MQSAQKCVSMGDGRKTVYLGMIGDIIHPGIINIVNEAAKRGRVMVGLFTDSAIADHKRLPYLNYEQRKAVVESIKGVDEVVPQDDWSYVPNLMKYRPDMIIHGDDWRTGTETKLRSEVFRAMEEIGGEVVEVPYTMGISSTLIEEDARSIGVTPEIRLSTLRRLIAAKKIVRVMEVHSGLTGLIVENVSVDVEGGTRSFDAMWSSSLCDSTNKGKPDIETVDITMRLQDLTDVLECTTKPIIYDGDTGGLAEHFVFTVRTLERNGISAVIIEDKTGLKKNSLFGTAVKQQLAPVEEFCAKISAGKKAQITEDFMIIARIEALIAGHGVDEALARAEAYVAAGADGIMIHSKEKDGKDIEAFCNAFHPKHPEVPIVLVPTTYNQYTEDELQSWGAKIVIYANHLIRAAYPAMIDVAETILKDGRSLEASEKCMPIKQILELIPGGKRPRFRPTY